METDYTKLYNRIIDGERDIAVALEVGLSVSALYKRFIDYGIITTKKRNTDEAWQEQYEAYKNGKKISSIAKDLNVTLTTVYNHFYSFGMVIKTSEKLDRSELYADYLAGVSIDELSRKYNKTATYIRYCIRLEAKRSALI